MPWLQSSDWETEDNTTTITRRSEASTASSVTLRRRRRNWTSLLFGGSSTPCSREPLTPEQTPLRPRFQRQPRHKRRRENLTYTYTACLDLETMGSQQARELRHSPCLMVPASSLLLIVVALFWMVAFVLKLPVMILNWMLQPALDRFNFVVEFLYPTGTGRFLHLYMSRMIQRSRGGAAATASGEGAAGDDTMHGFHSRTMESRLEVIPGRVFIHPLPQFMDNLGYLAVCLPRKMPTPQALVEPSNSSPLRITLSDEAEQRIVAFVVDCGDAPAVLQQLHLISDKHYDGQMLYVQSILSTHKHHDHTAGNAAMKNHAVRGAHLKLIVGGTVEAVPHCNFPVANGDIVPLPKYGTNLMEDLVEVEAVATPGHTRGSVAYMLRPASGQAACGGALAFLFTGDTMFSAGAGVPFEADLETHQDEMEARKSFTSFVKASAAGHAMERNLAEILARSVRGGMPGDVSHAAASQRVLVLPGHDYQSELLRRQLRDGGSIPGCRWREYAPAFFFETVSQMYVAAQRKTLPKSSGRLLSTLASPVAQELLINPVLRSLRRRGEMLLQAIHTWHRRYAREKVDDEHMYLQNGTCHDNMEYLAKTPATQSQWNLDATDLNIPVFATVYAADLDQVIADLRAGRVDRDTAAQRLATMRTALRTSGPLVSRRPIPGTLPSDQGVYRCLLALALLGSSPTALTLSDSKNMKLPIPIVASSDLIQVSKTRLIAVLCWLGLIDNDQEGRRNVAMIHQLWKESWQDGQAPGGSSSRKEAAKTKRDSNNTGDVESSGNPNKSNGHRLENIKDSDTKDLLDLADLKWTLFGVPRKQSKSVVSFCLPCMSRPQRLDPSHPAYDSGMKPLSGEMVRHDIYTCPVSRGATGLPAEGCSEDNGAITFDQDDVRDDDNNQNDGRPIYTKYGTTSDVDDGAFVEIDDGEESAFVEVSSILNEA